MQLIPVFFLFFFVLPTVSVDLTCPKSPITNKTPTGSFPNGGLTRFPINYNCGVEFEIPNGQVIKYIVQSSAIPGYGDSFMIRDSLSTLYEIGAGESIFYAPANKSKVFFSTTTDKSDFYFTWQYIDVTTYEKVSNPTGTILNLNLTGNHFYQFFSIYGPITFHTASLGFGADLSLSSIYVYDGEDLNAQFVGTLSQFTTFGNHSRSTGMNLTLVNFYGQSTRSYGIANDYAQVSGYENYQLMLLTSAHELMVHEVIKFGGSSAITFYCIDSNESYITALTLNDTRPGTQSFQVKPLTPSYFSTALLNYRVGDQIYSYLPQQILSNVFTVEMFQAEVSMSISSGPLPIWSAAYPGRRGYLLSPFRWNPLLNTVPAYTNNFTSTEEMRFVFNLEAVTIVKPGDQIRIEVGEPGFRPVHVTFNRTAVNTGTKAAYGTYMSTVFTGTTSTSTFTMTFQFESSSSTTISSVETTTKPAVSTFSLSVFLVVLFMIL